MFHPNMRATTEGFAVVGNLHCRSWKGVVADVWEVKSKAGAAGEYQSPYPRLFVLLDSPDTGAIRIGAKSASTPAASASARLSYIPAGLRTWSHVPVAAHLRHLDLHFDPDLLLDRFSGELDPGRLLEPQLMVSDAGVLALAHLLADECSGTGLHDLYGEGLALALLARFFQVPRIVPRTNQLSAHRLRQATDFIEANCLRKIRLQELADLAGLSPSYFSSAFKASTGIAPHQWQTWARVEQVKRMLQAPGASLTEVAIASGFSDQAHMTRIFKRYAGATPAAWVRNHAGS